MSWIVITIDGLVLGWVLAEIGLQSPIAGLALALVLSLTILSLCMKRQRRLRASALLCLAIIAVAGVVHTNHFVDLRLWDVRLGTMKPSGFSNEQLNLFMYAFLGLNALTLVYSHLDEGMGARREEIEDRREDAA